MSIWERDKKTPLAITGFEWVRRLGRGGFAETHLFRDLDGRYGEYVAVKIPLDKEREEPLIRGDLLSLASLRDMPNIVKMLDIKSVEGRYVLLMEFVDGPSLRQLIGAPGSGKRLVIEKALAYTLDVARGLAAAHGRRMVHRDIKPENIIIETLTDRARILDFGIASLVDTQGSFETVSKRHTPTYTPAEVLFEGKGDHRVDIYALGMTLFEMITGTLPYFEPDGNWIRPLVMMKENGPPSLVEINPDVPRYLEDVVQKAIAPVLDERYADMASFIEALEPPAELKMAQDHLAVGSVRRAEHVLRTLIERRVNDARGYIALAALLNRCQRPGEACEVLEKALALDPCNPDLFFRLGATWSKRGDAARTRAYLERAEELSTDVKLKRKIHSMLAAMSGKGGGK